MTPDTDATIEEHNKRLDETRERIATLRESIQASLDGDHQRAASLLDKLDEQEDDTDG